mgnify:CR=1 FL=1
MQRRGDWSRAGELTYGVIPELERKLKEAESAEGGRMLEEAVTDEHIAGVVSRWTGIPVDKMLVRRAREAPRTWSRICAAG